MSAPALFTQNTGIARGIAANYSIPGQDWQDTRQEALIALWQACRDWRPELGVPFRAFARMAIEADMRDALKRACRGKQLVLTDAVREFDIAGQGDACTGAIQRERVQLICRIAQDLPAPQRVALTRILNGQPMLGKAEDNARYKLRLRLKAAA